MSNTMEPSEHSERKLELAGWPVRLTTFKLGDTYHCTVDNVSPGARIARTEGKTKEEAEQKATEVAERRLARTRKMSD